MIIAKTRKFLFIWLFTLTLLVGCRNADTIVKTPTLQLYPRTPPTTETPTTPDILSPTATAKAPSKTQTPSTLPLLVGSLTPEASAMSIEFKCDNYLHTLDASGLTGSLALQSINIVDGSYLIDLAKGDRTLLLQNDKVKPLYFAESPNGKWLAYTGADTENSQSYSLIVISANSEERKVISLAEMDGASISYWLDNDWLVLHRVNLSGLDWLVLLNPVSVQNKWWCLA